MTDHRHRVSALAALKARIDTESPHANKLFSVIEQLQGGVEALIDLNANPNPTQTEAANFKRVQDGAAKLDEKRKAALASINTIMREGSKEVSKRLADKVKLVPNEFASEIRQLFRNNVTGDQARFLERLAIENKGPSLAAIVCAPTELTGVTVEMQERYKSRIQELHAPGETKELAALMASLEPALVALDVVQQVVTDFSDPYKLASIRQGEALAEAAQNKLNATLAA